MLSYFKPEKVYEKAKDLHVRGTYIHVVAEVPFVTYDEEGKTFVTYDDMRDLFLKGCFIADGNMLYKPTGIGIDDVAGGFIEYVKESSSTPGTPIIVKAPVFTPAVEPITYAISFVAADEAESLENASIEVFADEEMTQQVEDYSAVIPGTYYYSISKEGFTTYEGSVELVDDDEVVEITLEEDAL